LPKNTCLDVGFVWSLPKKPILARTSPLKIQSEPMGYVFHQRAPIFLALVFFIAPFDLPNPKPKAEEPNIVLVLADDWSWPHAGAYRDPVIQTPHFDRVAAEGVLFHHAYVSSPSCTPSRAALLTGQWHWRLGGGANLYGPLPVEHPVYTELLETAGYHTGFTRKGWAPGELGDRNRNPAGNGYDSFDAFLEARPANSPFVFWFGTTDPHRPYDASSGASAGIPIDDIHLPAIFPDSPAVRNDMADYFMEIQRLDRELGEMLEMLAALDELDHTIVVVTSDNGMPFPRAKSHLYDTGTRVPLAIRWPERIPGNREVEDFVSLTDLAPTFLAAAGLPAPQEMTGSNLMPVLESEVSGPVEAARDRVFFGKERHVPSQEAPDGGGYPMRGIRTADFLYIRNFAPDRWPAGTPHYEKAFFYPGWFADTDNGPTKQYMFENRLKDPLHSILFSLAFDKRPGEESAN
jgi:arylsulfatase A-like enzyme